MKIRRVLLPLSLLALAAPAIAQFSDSYSFIKAVKDRNGNKATDLLSKGGPNLIDTQDPASGERGLHIVVRERDMTWLGFLMGRGARIDLKDNMGNTPLMVAARIGNVDAARLLLSRNAQVNATNGVGETPLIMAVQQRDLVMTRLLLAQGADPARRDTASGMTARDYAVRDGRSDTLIKALDDAKPVVKKAIQGPK